jgi:hypothetical protein
LPGIPPPLITGRAAEDDTMLPTHDRYDYHAWPHRAAYAWPGGARLAVYLGVNLEHFAFGEGLGAELAPGAGRSRTC